jgi:hypothetical protein
VKYEKQDRRKLCKDATVSINRGFKIVVSEEKRKTGKTEKQFLMGCIVDAW